MLTELLAADQALARRLDDATDHDDKVIAAERFVDAQLALGQALARDPDLRWDGAMIDHLYATAPLIEHDLAFIARHADDTHRILGLPFEHDEWRRVVERRSAFEFLRELYADSSAGAGLGAIDLGPLDERLKFVGEREGMLTEIPDGIPTTHWWWWAPGSPPTD